MHHVFFYEAFEEELAALRRHMPPGVEAGYTWKTIQETGDSAPPAPLISIRTQSVLPPAWAPQLRGVLTRSTGYDHVLTWHARSGVAVPAGWLPLYCHRAVAEHAVIVAMALLRKLPRQVAQFRDFNRDGLTGRECLARRLLIVGVGKIGGEAARIAQALGMAVRGVDPVRRHGFIEYTTPEAGLPWADVVLCAMSLNQGNRGYFNAATFAAMKPGAIFVNVARGELSPAPALLAALDSGQLGGVGLDVYDREPELAVALRARKESDSPDARAVLALADRPDAILTPHNAFNTLESVDRKSEQSAQQIVHFMEAGAFLWPVPEEGEGDA